MLQIRPQGGGPAYAPNRDLANCFIPACSTVFKTLLDEPNGGWLRKYVEDNGVTEEQVVEVAKAFASYCSRLTDPALKTAGAALAASGFYERRPEACVVFLARLGIVMTGLAYGAVRDAHMAHQQPAGVAELLAQVESLFGGRDAS